MDLFAAIATLPLAPVRGLLAVAKVIQGEVDRQLYDPGNARRQIEQLESAQQSGDLSDADREQAEREIVGRLVAQPSDTTSDNGGEEQE
ncbi:MAG: gas vesicle protein G [Hamadaea sp.]|nr:gas vesicle protein G [Hamadaea sp.]NUR47463.1 gas vesicle protein G [Hamadaea sp.]NUT04871.1 gas vesicle protein G [Hamadaea sp.]